MLLGLTCVSASDWQPTSTTGLFPAINALLRGKLGILGLARQKDKDGATTSRAKPTIRSPDETVDQAVRPNHRDRSARVGDRLSESPSSWADIA